PAAFWPASGGPWAPPAVTLATMSTPLFAPPSIDLERRADGAIVLRSRQALAPHPPHLGLVLRERAAAHPARTFLAERVGDGARQLTYGEVWRLARRLGARMLADGLGPDRPLMIQ